MEHDRVVIMNQLRDRFRRGKLNSLVGDHFRARISVMRHYAGVGEDSYRRMVTDVFPEHRGTFSDGLHSRVALGLYDAGFTNW